MYNKPRIITEPVSNNRLHFHERGIQSIFVPSLIEGTLDDVVTGTETVIEGEVGGKIIAGKGLQHFVFLKNARVPTWIMDNHNHAFAFWHEALAKGFIQKGSLLVHIDQHTDLATPMAFLEKSTKEKKQKSEDYNKDSTLFSSLPLYLFPLNEVENYANSVLTIADFIVPALSTGLLSEALMVTGEDRNGAGVFVWEENQLKKTSKSAPLRKGESDGKEQGDLMTGSIIVDLDLDYFSQGFDEETTLATTRYWLAKADIVTVATSPLFIDQEKALAMLKNLQKDLLIL